MMDLDIARFLPPAGAGRARLCRPDAMDWIPGGPGKFSKPLRFFGGNAGFAELMRLEPGTEVPLHRHSGAVHAFNLEGERRLCTGERIEAGQYVYEPPGNTDSWLAVGDRPLVVMVVVFGEVAYLDQNGRVRQRVDASTQWTAYRQYCRSMGIEPLDLVD